MPNKRKGPLAITSLFLGIAFLALFWGASTSPGFSAASDLLRIFELSTPAASHISDQVHPTPTAISPTSWLDYVNQLRILSGLPVVIENVKWSEACQFHSQYMVKQDFAGHTEDPVQRWYTAEGAVAAENSNIMVSSSSHAPDTVAFDTWISQPFHGVGILDPQLEVVGFGSYREDVGIWRMAAALDILSGHTAAEPPAGTYPVIWPPAGEFTSILAYEGSEWPDPLTSCPGFAPPSGPPIYLQIGSGNLTPQITATSIQEGDHSLEHCVFDETSYQNPVDKEQQIGRDSLDSRDAIILIPQRPLRPGNTYTVSITANGQTYAWWFTTGQ